MMKNKRVLIVGAAPSVNIGLVDALAESDYVIACSGALQYVPDADMLVSIDGVPPANVDQTLFDNFAGCMLVGVPCGRGEFHHMPYEVTGSTHFRNNGISAIRIAVEYGATDITLAGFDNERYDAANAHLGFAGLTTDAFAKLIAELTVRGVTVKYYAPPVTTRKKSWTSGN